jgi:deoxyhypusine synthase
MSKGPISQFIEKHYLHFNSASLVDAAKAYEQQLANGAKMMVSMAGAMSTAEIGKIFSKLFVKIKCILFLVQVPILKKTL